MSVEICRDALYNRCHRRYCKFQHPFENRQSSSSSPRIVKTQHYTPKLVRKPNQIIFSLRSKSEPCKSITKKENVPPPLLTLSSIWGTSNDKKQKIKINDLEIPQQETKQQHLIPSFVDETDEIFPYYSEGPLHSFSITFTSSPLPSTKVIQRFIYHVAIRTGFDLNNSDGHILVCMNQSSNFFDRFGYREMKMVLNSIIVNLENNHECKIPYDLHIHGLEKPSITNVLEPIFGSSSKFETNILCSTL